MAREQHEEATKGSDGQRTDEQSETQDIQPDQEAVSKVKAVLEGRVQADLDKNPYLLQLKLTIVTAAILKLHSEKSTRAYLAKMAATEHVLQNGEIVRFDLKTMERWVRLYKSSGQNPLVLTTKTRADRDGFRKLTPIAMEQIKTYLEKTPTAPATVILNKLVEEHYVEPNEICAETIRRFIRKHDLRIPAKKGEKIRKSFLMEHIGEMWQADTCYYFKIPIPNSSEDKRQWVYIQGIMDDHSRYIVSAKCYLHDTAANFRETFMDAILHHHIPSMLLVDNGGPYVDSTLVQICGRLGIALIHTRSGDGAGKGAVERFWKHLEMSTILELALTEPQTVDEVQSIVDRWIESYHNRVNTGVNGKPIERYLQSAQRHLVRKAESKEWLIEQFCKEVIRRVNNDSTIQEQTIKFLVPDELAHERKLVVRYNPSNITGTIHAVFKNKNYPLTVDDPYANAKVKRNVGGRKTQLKEMAEAKAAKKRDEEQAQEQQSETLPLVLGDGQTLADARAEERYSRRMHGSIFLQPPQQQNEVPKPLDAAEMTMDFSIL